MALDAPPSTRVEDPLSLEGMDSATPDAMATYSQASPCEAMPEHTPNTIQVSHSPSLPVASKTLDVASISPCASLDFPSGLVQPAYQMRCFDCKGGVNKALEQLLMTRATLNPCQRELVQNANIARHQNENQATEAIKEVEVQCAATIKEAEAAIKEAKFIMRS